MASSQSMKFIYYNRVDLLPRHRVTELVPPFDLLAFQVYLPRESFA